MDIGMASNRWRGAAAQLRRLGILGVLAIAATTSISAAGAAGSESGAMVSAHWVKRKLDFTYMGFTTHYSCEGLRDNVHQVLLDLGARRSDLHVHSVGCTRSFGHPEPAPSVAGTFFVLEPATGSTEHPIAAAWQRVKVQIGRPGLDAAGHCELVEQVRHKVLPLFSTRNIDFKQNCIPHQLTLSGSTLSVEVLKPATRP